MSTNLLYDEKPLVILPSLAEAIGLNESIVLQQIHYWLKRCNNLRDGENWIFNTYEEWAVQFPFWSMATIQRIFKKLEEIGVIITGNFNRVKFDKTKWYRINYQMLEDIHNNTSQKAQPRVTESQVICGDGTCQSDMTNLPICDIEHVELTTPIPESTSESPSEIFSEKKIVVEEEAGVNGSKMSPFRFYEGNGFGSIGSFISEQIVAWSNDLSDELVVEALKIAVKSGSKNWKYVESILRDWVGKGYQTISEIEAAQVAFENRKKQQLPQKKKPVRSEIIPEWLAKKDVIVKEETNCDFEAEKQRMEEVLKKYRK